MKKGTKIEEDKGDGEQEIGWGVHQSETSKMVRREMLSKMKEDSVEPRAKVEGCVECE